MTERNKPTKHSAENKSLPELLSFIKNCVAGPAEHTMTEASFSIYVDSSARFRDNAMWSNDLLYAMKRMQMLISCLTNTYNANITLA